MFGKSKRQIIQELEELKQLNSGYEETINSLNEALEASVEKAYRYESILDCIPLQICTMDNDRNIVFINQKMAEVLGVSRDELVGRHCSEKKSPICNNARCAYVCLKKDESDPIFDIGAESFEASLSVLYNSKGEQGGYIEIVRDKTKDVQIKKFQENEISKLIEDLQRLAEGDLDLKLSVSEPNQYTYQTQKNFLIINQTIQEAIKSIKEYVKDASAKLAAVASENFDLEVELDYKGEFRLIKDSLNMIIANMNNIVNEIGCTVNEVEQGTHQIARGSQNIAQATTEQAATIEEIVTSVDTVAAQAKANAGNARKANDLTTQAQNVTSDGGKKIDQMMEAMDEINEASGEISKIIRVIEDIAFQTNILALNAAVEAARAGQHGKGFAVVAAEVRNLAAKSAKAANETATMIEGSIQRTSHGAAIAAEAAKAFSQIHDVVFETNEVVKQIAGASNDQALFIAEISQAMDQIAQTTHSNSQAAERSAAAGAQIAEQAGALKKRMTEFRVKKRNEMK